MNFNFKTVSTDKTLTKSRKVVINLSLAPVSHSIFEQIVELCWENTSWASGLVALVHDVVLDLIVLISIIQAGRFVGDCWLLLHGKKLRHRIEQFKFKFNKI